jgi:hypothetical protein
VLRSTAKKVVGVFVRFSCAASTVDGKILRFADANFGDIATAFDVFRLYTCFTDGSFVAVPQLYRWHGHFRAAGFAESNSSGCG